MLGIFGQKYKSQPQRPQRVESRRNFFTPTDTRTVPATAKPKKTKGPIKAAKKTAPPKADAAKKTLRSWFFRPSPLIILSVIVSIGVMLPYVPHLLPQLTDLEEYQIELAEIRVNVPNQWVPGTLVEEVLTNSELPEKVSALRSGLCRDVAQAFKDNPWVREVKLVRLTPEPAIQAVLDYREPVAFVAFDDGVLPVDRDGVALPVASFSSEDVERLPHILNVSSTSDANGQPWDTTVVRAAAQIAEILVPDQDIDRYWNPFKLKGILAPSADEPGSPNQLKFEILTEGGSHIIWGNPPGSDQLEPTAEQKLGRMEQYVERFGDFDSPNGPYRIDIRLFESTSVESLSELYYR